MAKVEGMMPIVGRKQHVDKETGQVVEGKFDVHAIYRTKVSNNILDWELVFADDEREANPTSFKFLQMAHAWKNAQAKKTGGSGLLSGFTAATSESTGAPAPSTSRVEDDVQMRERREDDSSSDVASSDGE